MLRDKNATYPQIGLLTSLFVCLLTSLFLAAAQFRAEFNTPTPGFQPQGIPGWNATTGDGEDIFTNTR